MNLFIGITSLGKALRMLIKHPSLLLLSSLIGVIACTISISGIWYVLDNGDALGELMISSVGLTEKIATDGFARQLIDYLIKGLGIVTTLLVLPWIIGLIGFPICTPLADRTDTLMGGREAEVGLLHSISSSISLNLRITLVGMTIGVALYLLTWIPIVGLIFSFISAFIWTPLVMCLNVYENSLSRRGLTFRQMCRFLLKDPVGSIMVGGQTILLISIPVLNLLGLPLAVIAGVIAVREREERELTRR